MLRFEGGCRGSFFRIRGGGVLVLVFEFQKGALRGEKLNYKSCTSLLLRKLEMFKCFYSILKIYNFRNIEHFLKRILQVIDNAVFWQNVLLYFENDPLSPSF